MTDHDPAGQHWVDAANAARRAAYRGARRAGTAATAAALRRARVKAALADAPAIVKPVTTDPNQDTAMPDVLASARQRLATRRRPDPTVRENVSDATPAHVALQLPAGVCLYCGIGCGTTTTVVALPGFPRGVAGSVCTDCAADDPAADPVAFVCAQVKAAYPDPGVLPGHLVATIAAATPPAPVAAATWAGHVQTLFGRGRPDAPAPNAAPWGHLANPSQ